MGKQKKPRKRGHKKKNRKRRRKGAVAATGPTGRGVASPPARGAAPTAVRAPEGSVLAAQLSEALKEGRLRRAVALARQLGEVEGIGEQQIALIADAYRRHLRELVERGHHAKAAGVFARLEADRPEWVRHLPEALRIELELRGTSASLLAAYETESGTRGVVDRCLPAVLEDVRALARHPLLPESHELKRQAATIARAWQAVEAREPRAADLLREMKRAVGRRSPLVDWRLFVQAVADFYAGRAEETDQALRRVADGGAVAPMAAILRELNAGQLPQGRAASLVSTAMSGDPLRMRLSEIDALVAARKWKEAARALHRLPKERRELRDRPQLQRLLGACYVGHAGKEVPSPALEGGQIPLGGREAVLVFMSALGFDESDDWEHFLHTQGGGLAPIEKALVCDRIASRVVDESGRFPLRRGGRDRQGFKEAESWWRRSVEAHPLRSTYQHWYAAARPVGALQAEKVMQRWHEALPEDEQPLSVLVHSCRARGVFQKAAGYFRKLDRLAMGRPDVETLRAFITADEAARHLRSGRHRRAEEALAAIAAEQESFAGLVRHVLACILEMRDGDPSQAREDLLRARHPLLIATIAQGCHERGLPEARAVVDTVRPQSHDVEMMAADFHQLTRARDPVWGARRSVVFFVRVVPSLGRTTLASEALRDCLDHVLRLDPGLNSRPCFELANAITANGIRRRDELWPVFLCYRALMLRSGAIRVSQRWIHRRRQRIRRCLRLAWQTASERGNSEHLRLVESMAERVLGAFDRSAMKPLPDRVVEKVVADEGNLDQDRIPRRKPLLGGTGRSARPGRPRQAPPEQPGLF